MPLYKLPSASLPNYVAFFNRHAIDGLLRHCVIKGLLQKQGYCPKDEEVQRIINAISIDSSGVNCQAFIDLISNYHELRNPDTEYKSAFRLYDVQKSGRLSKEDVSKMFKQMHMGIDVEALFEEADLDRNGTIEYEEFKALMERI